MMITRKPSTRELMELREIAELQFGVKGEEFIPSNVLVGVSPNTEKIRFILYLNRPYLGLRSRDYRFNLYIPSGIVLNQLLPKPKLRVFVKNEYAPFVKSGKTLFCKHVLAADPSIRPDDEVLVLDQQGELIAVGRAARSGWEMVYYKRGVAVKIREGVGL
ncbi:MAG: PUA domain-containing protein [Desulfurococcaceae archaeon]|jgi:uncharacterized protein with predicted RNA binding PUA domain